MKRIIISLSILFAIVVSVHGVQAANEVKNVFDEMYYAHDRTTTIPYTLTSYRDVHIDHRNEEAFRYPKEGVFYEDYLGENFLESNEFIQIQGDMNLKTLTFACRIRYDSYVEIHDQPGPSLWFEYTYNIEEKTLTMNPLYVQKYQSLDEMESSYPFLHDANIVADFLASRGITNEEIEEWNNYFIYQKILSDWFCANERTTHYAMENLGKIEIINNQFPEK